MTIVNLLILLLSNTKLIPLLEGVKNSNVARRIIAKTVNIWLRSKKSNGNDKNGSSLLEKI